LRILRALGERKPPVRHFDEKRFMLPLQGHGDFGTSAFFGQLSDKPVLARIRSHGVRGAKRNGWSKIKR